MLKISAIKTSITNLSLLKRAPLLFMFKIVITFIFLFYLFHFMLFIFTFWFNISQSLWWLLLYYGYYKSSRVVELVAEFKVSIDIKIIILSKLAFEAHLCKKSYGKFLENIKFLISFLIYIRNCNKKEHSVHLSYWCLQYISQSRVFLSTSEGARKQKRTSGSLQ